MSGDSSVQPPANPLDAYIRNLLLLHPTPPRPVRAGAVLAASLHNRAHVTVLACGIILLGFALYPGGASLTFGRVFWGLLGVVMIAGVLIVGPRRTIGVLRE